MTIVDLSISNSESSSIWMNVKAHTMEAMFYTSELLVSNLRSARANNLKCRRIWLLCSRPMRRPSFATSSIDSAARDSNPRTTKWMLRTKFLFTTSEQIAIVDTKPATMTATMSEIHHEDLLEVLLFWDFQTASRGFKSTSKHNTRSVHHAEELWFLKIFWSIIMLKK